MIKIINEGRFKDKVIDAEETVIKIAKEIENEVKGLSDKSVEEILKTSKQLNIYLGKLSDASEILTYYTDREEAEDKEDL